MPNVGWMDSSQARREREFCIAALPRPARQKDTFVDTQMARQMMGLGKRKAMTAQRVQ